MDFLKTKFDLSGKVVVIADGLDARGLKYAEAVALSGGNPVILGNNQEGIDCALNYLNKKCKVSSLGFVVDLLDKAQLLETIKSIMKSLKKVDVLINNYTCRGKKISPGEKGYFNCPEDYPLELWEHYIKQNINTVFLVSQQFGKIMIEGGKGVILNIVPAEAIEGLNPRKYSSSSNDIDKIMMPPIHYPVAKASIINFTRFLATYWAQKDIRVNCLVTGDLNTDKSEYPVVNPDYIPLSRLASPEELSGAVVYMISDASSYMTGSIVVADGGLTCW
jgi:NAD(P)-dependent dehydrogenase (short-subunit alcohol dehydrogenase family)